MTIDDLTKLDTFGHRRPDELTEAQLRKYANLLERRRQEVLDHILQLRKKGRG